MPTPVLEIPIDDKDFKAFLATFKKYQEELEKQPGMWGDIGDGISVTTSAANDFAKSLQTQVDSVEKLSRAEETREKQREDISRKKRKDRDDEERQEERAATRRRRAVDQVREYARNIGTVASKGGSWAAGAAEGALGTVGGGAAGLIGGAGSLLRGVPLVGGVLGGLATAGYEVMSNLNSSRQRAGALGVGVATLQGWQDALGPSLPSGSAENLLSTVSQAQATPGGGGLFGRFNIKDAGTRSVSDISAEMLIHAQKYLKANPGQKGLFGASALFGGAMDTGMLRTLQTMSPKELQADIANAKKFENEHKDADKTALKATQDLSSAELTASDLLDKFGSKVTSAADQLTTAFKALYNSMGPIIGVLGGAGKLADWKVWGGLGDIHSDKPHNAKLESDKGRIMGSPTGFFGEVGDWLAKELGADKSGLVGGSKADRNNNPGNIMSGLSYNRYSSPAAGFAAMARQLQIDYNKHGSHSISALINGSDHPWASEHAPGNSHAATMNYIAHVAGALGVSATQNINLNDRNTLSRVAKAMYEFESGHGVGMPRSDTNSHKKIAEAVKSGTIQAHKHLQHRGHHIKVKVEHKPGSDTTVSARQLAGH